LLKNDKKPAIKFLDAGFFYKKLICSFSTIIKLIQWRF